MTQVQNQTQWTQLEDRDVSPSHWNFDKGDKNIHWGKTASITIGIGETGYLYAEEKNFILLFQPVHKSTTNASKSSVLELKLQYFYE